MNMASETLIVVSRNFDIEPMVDIGGLIDMFFPVFSDVWLINLFFIGVTTTTQSMMFSLKQTAASNPTRTLPLIEATWRNLQACESHVSI